VIQFLSVNCINGKSEAERIFFSLKRNKKKLYYYCADEVCGHRLRQDIVACGGIVIYSSEMNSTSKGLRALKDEKLPRWKPLTILRDR
jgi:hypothetical protein